MSSFIEWLREFGKPEIVWFLIGLLLIIAEFTMPGLIIIYFGLGAIFTAVCCLMFNISINFQIVLFVAFSVVSLLLTRHFMKKVFTGNKFTETEGFDVQSEYVGHSGVAITDIAAGGEGKIEFHGSDWRATSDEAIDKGCRIVIVGHKNLTLKVKADK
jgi:inner membrane protein